jgi:hypothetical protein
MDFALDFRVVNFYLDCTRQLGRNREKFTPLLSEVLAETKKINKALNSHISSAEHPHLLI